MAFESDPDKGRSNKKKHGIDFEEAQQLWADGNLVEYRVKVMSEVRYVAIGMIEDKHWTAVITYREDNIRIISVRRSRNKEIKGYESRGI